MPWPLSLVLVLISTVVVLLALRSEHRILVDRRGDPRHRGRVPAPTRRDLLRAALLPGARVRFWCGICGFLCLAPLVFGEGTDAAAPGAVLLLFMGLVGVRGPGREHQMVRAGTGPDADADPWDRRVPQPGGGTLLNRGRAATGLLLAAGAVVATVWGALGLAALEPIPPWWPLVALLAGLPVACLGVYLLHLALARVSLSGSWIRVVHRLHVTYVPVELVERVEARRLHLSDGRAVLTGVDLDAERISRFLGHTRAGLGPVPQRKVQRDRELPFELAFLWLGVFLLLAL
ncbi:hypothetical protein [Nocardiopsis ganjiahuensis]|uniref:hypothetical protein n=1 Tax=Nocardiopsis ganjiahuensis TaxID=239984 RepID=UPI0003449F60|nr:hypothetical protein [Nocardiopsis ganjiahuensis]